MGWIVYRQAILYSEEYGWDASYEALASEIVAKFIKNFDPKWERAWVAEKDGERVGAVFVAKESDEIAKLRLLHVEPQARGLGIGKRLVAAEFDGRPNDTGCHCRACTFGCIERRRGPRYLKVRDQSQSGPCS